MDKNVIDEISREKNKKFELLHNTWNCSIYNRVSDFNRKSILKLN